MSAGEIAARLEELAGTPLAEPPRRVSSGASRETWLCAFADGRELVLQSRPADAGMVDEPPLLALAHAAGVPVPEVVRSGRDDPALGVVWALATRLPGTADPRAIHAGSDPGELLGNIAASLARIHSVAPPADLFEIADPVAFERERSDGFGQPHPVFEMALRRLGATRPESARRTLVHGDFRIGNLLVDGNRLTGVLDWELAHAGDPLEDLGWLCVRAWRFGRPDRPAAGLGTREELAAAYESAAGVAVDRDALAWWELLGNLRWGIICIQQAFAHLSGSIQSLEHAVIGRRAAEVEWDLLDLLEDGAAPPPAPAEAGPAPAPHDRPHATELLAAARAALGDDVLPAVDDPRATFQLRVAMRALGIVMRELEHGPAHAAERASALDALGARDEKDAARRARAGDYDSCEGDALAAMRRLVRIKLEAANPRHIEGGP